MGVGVSSRSYTLKCKGEDEVIKKDIRLLMAAMDITQEQLARICGVTRPTLRKWINQPGTMHLSDYRLLHSLVEEHVKGEVQ